MRTFAFLTILGVFAGCGRSPHGRPGDDGAATLRISPPSVILAPNGAQRFTANRPVSWSLTAADAGTIDAEGSYLAPPAPGSYAVTASATDGSGLTAVAHVIVRPWRLELLAGSLGGAGNADDRGVRARFSGPGQVALDGAGGLYIADYGSGSVRRLDLASGIVTTFAKSDLLRTACGLAFDGEGGLYAGTGSGLINRINLADHSIVTVTGIAYSPYSTDGTAAEARFYSPCGLSWDPGRQRLYIADGAQGIRYYDRGAARVRTLQSWGGGWAGVAFAGGSDLYVSSNWLLGRVDADSGQLTILAGAYDTGFADGVGMGGHFSTGGQIALDLANNALYVGDRNVRKVDLGTRLVTTVGPRDFAWGGPGIAYDGAGGLYVTSQEGNAVLHESVNGGDRTVVAGQPSVSRAAAWLDGVGAAARFATPAGLAYDGRGALLVADGDNGVVRRVDVASGAVSTLAGIAGRFDRDGIGTAGVLLSPSHAVADGSGGYLVVESRSHTVRRWAPASDRVTTIAGVDGLPGIDDGIGKQARFDEPGGICVIGRAAYVADKRNHTLRKIDLATRAVSTVAGSPETRDRGDGGGTGAGFYEPIDVACDGDKTVYVLESGGRVRIVDVVTGGVGTLAYAGSYAGAIALDKTHAYVAVSGSAGPLVKRIALADGSMDSVSAPADAAVLVSLATDGDGNVYTTSRFGQLYRIAGDGTVTVLANAKGYYGAADGPLATATFGWELGLAWDNGALLVAETGADRLRRIDLTAGVVSTIQGAPGLYWPVGGPGNAASLGNTVGLAVDGGHLYATCAGLVDIDLASANVSVLVPTDHMGAPITVGLPRGVVSDGHGHVYFADKWVAAIRRLDLADGSVHTIAGSGVHGMEGSNDGVGTAATFTDPEGLALDADTLYVADAAAHNIRAVRLSDGSVSTFAGVAGSPGANDGSEADARFNAPTALASDGKGALYVADSNNGLIRRIDLASATVTTVIGVAGQNGVVTGNLPARLNHPSGIAVLPGGSLAISDEQAILIVR